MKTLDTNDTTNGVETCVTTTVTSPWLTAHQGRKYLKMQESEFAAKLNTGEIRSVKRGRTRYVKTEWLDQWMESLPSGAKVPAALVG